jgi:hypothetical protein
MVESLIIGFGLQRKQRIGMPHGLCTNDKTAGQVSRPQYRMP